jgi:hypothetical protein
MEILRVPRRVVPVRILLDDGRTLNGGLFTSMAAPGGGSERLVDHLNDPTEEFIPFAYGDDRFLLNKSGIVTVQVPDGLGEVEGYEEVPEGHEIAVRISLAGGTSLLGRFFVLMPPERSRVLDYLNAAPRFLPLIGDGFVTLVHRRFIVSVRSQ